jgi:hypothetical protein
MKNRFLSMIALATLPLAAPVAALAMPAVGDMIGTDAETAKATLEKAGCPVKSFEAEGGKVEAQCTDAATGKLMEVYIDPASGKVTEIKEKD